jgi:hypothetical protein
MYVNLLNTLREKEFNVGDHFIDIDVHRWDYNISRGSGKNKLLLSFDKARTA